MKVNNDLYRGENRDFRDETGTKPGRRNFAISSTYGKCPGYPGFFSTLSHAREIILNKYKSCSKNPGFPGFPGKVLILLYLCCPGFYPVIPEMDSGGFYGLG